MLSFRKKLSVLEEGRAAENAAHQITCEIARERQTSHDFIPRTFNDSSKFLGDPKSLQHELLIRQDLALLLFTSIYTGNKAALEEYSRSRTVSLARLTKDELFACLKDTDSCFESKFIFRLNDFARYGFAAILPSMIPDKNHVAKVAKEMYRKSLGINVEGEVTSPVLKSDKLLQLLIDSSHTDTIELIKKKTSITGLVISDEKFFSQLIINVVNLVCFELMRHFNQRALIHLAIHDLIDVTGVDISHKMIIAHAAKFNSFEEFIHSPQTDLMMQFCMMVPSFRETDPDIESKITKALSEGIQRGGAFSQAQFEKWFSRIQTTSVEVERTKQIVRDRGEDSNVVALLEKFSDLPKDQPWRIAMKLIHEAQKIGVTIEQLEEKLICSSCYAEISTWIETEKRKQSMEVQNAKIEAPTIPNKPKKDVESWKILIATINGERVDHAFFKSTLGLSKAHEEAIKRRIDNLSLNQLGHCRAILHHFRSTGVIELKLDGGYRVFLTQTGEKEYTILGITTKENQAKEAQNAITLSHEVKKGSVDTQELKFNEQTTRDH